MDREQDLTQFVARLRRDTNARKAAQPIIGDSWIVYRIAGTIPSGTGSRTIIFTPNFPNNHLVARLWVKVAPDFSTTEPVVPHSTQLGVWTFYYPANAPYDFMIYSTQDGSIQVT